MADWHRNDVIEVRSSPLASPLVPVRKKDGEVRWAVDFRKLNASLEQDSYPLPKISSLLECAGGHQVYSTLDATAAYFNKEIEPNSRQLTAFSTPEGLYQFYHSGCVQSVHHRNEPLGSDTCKIYLDDVITYNDKVAAHVPQRAKVFEVHRVADIKLKPKKSLLFRKEIDYLGH